MPTYTHPDYEVKINAAGGYRVLESLGFKSEFEIVKEEKKREYDRQLMMEIFKP